MIKHLGRIIARGKIAGLYLPFRDSELYGIYDIKDIMGEISVVWVGDPAMPKERFTGISLDDLFDERAICGLTQKEYKEVCK